MSLVARHLEANGISTVVLGSARDVVEQCGVPRFLFSDFPLGNPCGPPYDLEVQRQIAGFALDLAANATLPRTTVQTPFVWSDGPAWKAAYLHSTPAQRSALQRAGEARRAKQRAHKQEVEGRSSNS